MSDFTIITCISKPDIYEKCLLNSINKARKKHDIEIIPIINTNNLYTASIALNLGIDASRSKYLIFAHQDVCLLYDWFDTLKEYISELPENWGIIGSAGIALQYQQEDIGVWGGALNLNTVAVGSVWDNDIITESPYWDGIKTPTPIHCVDECLFVLNKETGLRFDTMFNGFHFYGVDICLQARAAAYTVYGAHLPIIHYGKYSTSFIGDKKYWVYLRFLYNKWRFNFPNMYGTHMHWVMRPVNNDNEINLQSELTSYISIGLDANDDCPIEIKAMGLNKIKLITDKNENYIDYSN